MMQDSQHIRKEIVTIFQNHFRSSSSRTIQHLSLNVYLLLVGMKPAYLLDQNPFGVKVDIETKLSVFDRLLNDVCLKFAVKNQLGAISIRKEDIVIININSVLSNLEDETNQLFVDISSQLKEPRMLTDPTAVTAINRMITSLLVQLQPKEKTCFQLQTKSNWNISTLFGILLSYPIVYYYSDVSECVNCLAHVDLHSQKLFVQLEGLTDQQLIYSFTYPVLLNEFCAIKTDSWTRVLQQQFSNFQISLERTIVNLDVVLL